MWQSRKTRWLARTGLVVRAPRASELSQRQLREKSGSNQDQTQGSTGGTDSKPPDAPPLAEAACLSRGRPGETKGSLWAKRSHTGTMYAAWRWADGAAWPASAAITDSPRASCPAQAMRLGLPAPWQRRRLCWRDWRKQDRASFRHCVARASADGRVPGKTPVCTRELAFSRHSRSHDSYAPSSRASLAQQQHSRQVSRMLRSLLNACFPVCEADPVLLESVDREPSRGGSERSPAGASDAVWSYMLVASLPIGYPPTAGMHGRCTGGAIWDASLSSSSDMIGQAWELPPPQWSRKGSAWLRCIRNMLRALHRLTAQIEELVSAKIIHARRQGLMPPPPGLLCCGCVSRGEAGTGCTDMDLHAKRRGV